MPATALRPRAFYPALDGLRAVAFLAVFFYHYGAYASTAAFLRWGWIGVDVFFVLSGFLITGILYDSAARPRYFRDFYLRRSLRIFPLFYAFWLLMLILTPFIGIQWNRYSFAMATYTGNFFYAGALALQHPSPGFLNCTHLLPRSGADALDIVPFWSLCIEEQFYLVWPLVLWRVRSRRALLGLCAVVFLVSPLLRELYWHLWPATAQHAATYFNTFTRVDTLLAGAALALVLRGPAIDARLYRRAAYLLLTLPLGLLTLLVMRFSPNGAVSTYDWIDDRIVNTLGFSLIALFAAGLVLLAIQPETWLYRALHTRPLLAIGRRSYGLYLVHAVPLRLLAVHLLPRLRAHHLGLFFLPLALAYTFTAGWLSFRYLESPFLRWKDRLAPTGDARFAAQPRPAEPVPIP